MPRVNAPLYALNGGEIGKDALARFDLDKLRYAAELNENAFPEVIGRLRIRPGLEDLGELVGKNGGNVRFIPFVVDANTQYLLVITEDGMRVVRDGEYLSRAAVSTTITNGDFSSFTGWSDESTGSASAGVSGGNLVLSGASGAEAVARQAVTVTDTGVEHGLAVDVARGPVELRIGTTAGGNELLGPVALEEGSHNIAFTPTGNFSIDLRTDENRDIIVSSAQISASGVIEVDHPWTSADLQSIRYDQSLDVIFVASDGLQQRRIERRGDTSWSIVRYKTFDGPFEIAAASEISITPSVTSGNGTLTASRALFQAGDVGSLLRLTHLQQLAERTYTAESQIGEPIRVVGVDSSRAFAVSIVGTSFTGTITLEQSIGEVGNWTPFRTYTGNTSTSVDDGLDNQIVFYRLVIQAGDFTSGSAVGSLRYQGGSTQGIARIVGFTSATAVDMEVLQPFGDTAATTTWDQGSWSDARGWPNTIALHDGRLWWGRGGLVYGSVSDSFASYSDTVVGDSAPVIRSLGAGPARGAVWLQSLQRLIAGTDISEVSIRASSFDEPLTASAFVPRDASTRGCADIAPVKVDTSAVFVQRSGFRIFDMILSAEASDYISRDLTELHTDVCRPGVVSMAIQRQPDTRIWFVLSDGTARVLTYEPSESVVAWSRVTIDGTIDEVQVLPSINEDQVYLSTVRNLNGSDVSRLERMASIDETRGGQINKVADSFVQIQNDTPSAVIDGLDHLEGEQVVVWADGTAIHDQDNMATVSGGAIPNTTAYTNVIVGKPYNARWKSIKLAYGAALGTALTQYKKVDHLGLYFVETAPDGLRIGRSFDNLTKIAVKYRGRNLVPGEVLEDWDQDAPQFNGGWDTDSRVCIEMRAPYPVSVSAMTINIKTNDRG